MLNKKSKIILSTTLLVLGVSAITYFVAIRPTNMKAKETMAVATTPEVKPTTTPESTSIPKEEPTTTPVATSDNSEKVTTPSDSNTTSTTSNTGTKSGTTSSGGSKSGSTGGTSSGNTGSTGGSTSGGTTTTPTNPPSTPTPTNPPSTPTPTNPPTTPTPTTPTTPEPPKYTPSYTLRDDLANEIFNAVSKYRQDNGFGALTRISSYNSIAQNYLSYRIDAQPKPDLTQVYAHYTSQEGGWSAEALAGVIGRADRWQGGNTTSVKVAQKGDNYYVCFTVKK